jgi:DNA-binding transcriptional LysR family regulator
MATPTINLTHLEAFCAVAETSSVSRAAERLMVSQPAVSKQLALLERALKVRLVDRLPRGVRLTAAGEELARHGRRVFAARDEAGRAMAELAGTSRGRLAIAATPTIGTYLLPAILVRYRRAHPGVEMRMEVHPTATIARLLVDGAADVGLAESAPEDDGVEARVFRTDAMVAICAPGGTLLRRVSREKRARQAERPIGERAISVERLCAMPFVVREVGSGSKSLVERALADRGLAVRPVMSLGSTEAIKRAVIEGVGVAVVSRLAVEAELAGGRLCELRVRGLRVARPLYLLTARGRTASAAVEAFVRMVG